MTHYARLGVPVEASTEQIRSAYRNLARLHHPDRVGTSTSVEMMEINEAWRVLSDPVLRRAYDTRLRSGSLNGSGGSSGGVATNMANLSAYRPGATGTARFPWRFVMAFFMVITAAIIIMGAFTEQGEPTPVDNVIRVGSCVDLDEQVREAREVSCDGPHDGQVDQMIPFDAKCPSGTESYRDRQGLGLVCIV
jgi:molecular chaperone DnaJ